MATGAASGGSSAQVAIPVEFIFSFSGSLNANQDVLIPKIASSFAGTVTKLSVVLQEAPTGSSAIFEFFKNASSLGTVTVAASATSGTTTPAATAFVDGDVFSVTINQAGSAYRGSTATMSIRAVR